MGSYKEIKDGQWTWEFNDSCDVWTRGVYDTIEETIKEAYAEIIYERQDEYFSGFYIGEIKKVSYPVIVIDNILEQLGEQMYDEVGEVAEDYLRDVTPEHEKELEDKFNEVFQEWAEKYNYKPTFFKISNISFISIEKAREIYEQLIKISEKD